METLLLDSCLPVAQFQFLRPAWLAAFIPVVWIWWRLVHPSRSASRYEAQIAPHLLKHLMVQSERKRRLQPSTLLLPVWCLATIALAGPSWRVHPSPFLQDQSNLWIVLKLSPSMESNDLLPSRLERTRNKIHDLMKQRDGTGTGLVVYSKSAHLVMPATNDSAVIDQMLQSLDPAVMPGEGDALLDALEMTARHTEKDDSPASILLIADAVAPEQLLKLSQAKTAIQNPIQWLIPIRPDSSFDGLGIEQAAKHLDASLVPLTLDDSDVQAIVRHTHRAMVDSPADSSAPRMDDGYWLLWPITFIAAMWCRRGWNLGESS